MLFGSGWADQCSGTARLRLATAEIAEDQRTLISGGNIERLLAEVDL